MPLVAVLTIMLGVSFGAHGQATSSPVPKPPAGPPASQPRGPLGKTITRPMITGGNMFMLGLRADGTCLAAGDNASDKCNVAEWKDVIVAEAGYNHSVGLKADGTVVAVGLKNGIGVSDWKDIVAIAAGYSHTVGLKSDGTVVVAGTFGNDPKIAQWKDIVAIGAGMGWTVGVQKDGTCMAVGYNANGMCEVSDWKDIVAVACTYGHTLGLKSDGTVVVTGFKPNTPKNTEISQQYPVDVSKWTRIVDLRGVNWMALGLRDDGAVEYRGRNDVCGPCGQWRDIAAVGVTEGSVLGVKPDGSVVRISAHYDRSPLSVSPEWNLGPVDPKLPRVPHGRDRRLPWPPADWKPADKPMTTSSPASRPAEGKNPAD